MIRIFSFRNKVQRKIKYVIVLFKMIKLIYYPFAFLYIQSMTVTATEVKELVYNYSAKVITGCNSDSQSIVRWTLQGYLIVQYTENYTIIKLDNLTTSIYNGPAIQMNSSHENISVEAQVLHLPVVIHYDDYDEEEEMLISHISTVPEDPEWSVNMKRAICSIFQFRSSFLTEDAEESDALEDNIYGNCEVHYSGKHLGNNDYILKKKIMHSSCTSDNLDISEPHLYKSKIDDHLVLNISTERTYIFTDINDKDKIRSIESTSNISYTAIRGENIIMNIIQRQTFELISYSSKERIDITRNSVNKNMVFELGNNTRFGTGHEAKTSEQLLQEYNNITYEFKEEYSRIQLGHADGRMNDTVAYLIELLNTMNYETLRKIAEDKSNKIIRDIFISLLPYIETEHTVKISKLFLSSESFKNYNIIKFLLTVVNKDMLKNLEHFVKLNTTNGRQPLHVINFATLVAKLHKEKLLTKEEFMEYVNLYLDAFNSEEAAKDYEIQMSFILGLINMADGVNIDIILELALANKYSRHIRSLAIYGFKKQLASHPELVFNKIWPIVENTTEHLEVRIAALDLLLSTQLSEEQFYTIIKTYSGQLLDIREQHVQHYIYTTLQSLQKTTVYNSLSNVIETAFKNFTISKSSIPWWSGNYRLSYTDSSHSFGAMYQVQLVAKPDCNTISSIQFSYNGFAMSARLQSYTAYFKLEGIAQYLFADAIFKRRLNNNIDVAELIELIKKNHYKIKEDVEVHVEIILYVNGQVVYVAYYNRESLKNIQYNDLYFNILQKIKEYNTISFPIKKKIALVSDLGTYIEIKSEKEDVMLHTLHTQYQESSDSLIYTLKHRSSSKVEECVALVNPLDNVRFGVRKFRMSRVLIDVPVILDWQNLIIKWKNNDIIVNIAADRSLSTYVRSSEKILAKYCTLCQHVSENRDSEHQQAIFPVHILGIKINISIAGKLAKTERNNLHQFLSNSDTFPAGKLFLVQDFLANHFLYAPSYKPYSISILQQSKIQPIPTETSLQLYAAVDTNTHRNYTLQNYTLNMTLSLTEMNLNSDTIINQWNVTCIINSQVKIMDLTTRLDNSIQVYYRNLKGQKLCIDFRMLYPNRTNMFSNTIPEPTTYNITISKGNLHVNDTIIVQILGTLSATDEQMTYVKEMKEYEICVQNSVGLKYTPPSQACSIVSHVLNKYPTTDIQIHTKQNTNLIAHITKYLNTALERFFAFRMYKFNPWRSRTINISIIFDMKSSEIKTKVNKYRNKLNYTQSKYQIHSMIPVVRYNNLDVALDLGFRSSCSITSTFVKNFAGNYITHEKKLYTYMAAFVECFGNPRVALTFRKLRNGKLGFKLWSDNKKLITFVANDSLVVTLDGEQLKENYDKKIGNDHLRVYFLGENELLVIGSEVELYFNTEYITVQVWSPYTTFLCGICTD